MDTDKENVNRHKPITRIPLPLTPLPPLPKHLLCNKNTDMHKNLRNPLQTLSNSSQNPNIATSSNQNHCKPSCSQKNENLISLKKKKEVINTKHVTIRSKNETLDWDNKVFKDESVISISDVSESKHKNCRDESCLAVTPAIQSIENRAILNIKRSLKRPHSRELRGLSPVRDKKEMKDEKVKRRLQFNEKLQERLQSPDYWKKSYMRCLTCDYAGDMLEYLLAVERKPLNVPMSTSITRARIINWLIKINGPDGNPAIVQSACWYFDSILGISHVSLSNLQLVAAACYWIAHKLHGPRPVMRAKNLVKCSRFAFNEEKLVATEKGVLNKLQFPIQPVVPQEFITYLAWWCNKTHPGEIEAAATFLCMSGLMDDMALCEEYPSVIAAAAVRNALLLLGKGELLSQLELWPLYHKVEKKTSSMSWVSSILRRAVRIISAPIYEYKTLYEHYGMPPHYIAHRVIDAAAKLAVMEPLTPGTPERTTKF